MASATGQLSGAADMTVTLNIWLVSQNAGANLSTFYWEVVFDPKGNPTWAANAGIFGWAASVGGQYREGRWEIAYADRGKVKVVGNGYVDAYHDSNGIRPGFANSAYIDGSAHSNIGSGGSGDVFVDAPRFPRGPGAPGVPYIYSFFNGGASVRLILPPSSDDGGATIDMYLIRMSANDSPETAPYVDLGLSPSQLFGDFHNLLPGTRYRAYGYAHNSVGWARQNTWLEFTTEAGIYVSDGTAWKPSGMRSSDGVTWAVLSPKISDGDSWEDPIDV